MVILLLFYPCSVRRTSHFCAATLFEWRGSLLNCTCSWTNYYRGRHVNQDGSPYHTVMITTNTACPPCINYSTRYLVSTNKIFECHFVMFCFVLFCFVLFCFVSLISPPPFFLFSMLVCSVREKKKLFHAPDMSRSTVDEMLCGVCVSTDPTPKNNVFQIREG